MDINKCVLLFSVVLCILLFYKLSQKETFQGIGTTATTGTTATRTIPAGSGIAMCEEKGYNKTECMSIGCCQWDESVDECHSDVDDRPCKTSDRTTSVDNGETMCEGHGYDRAECMSIGCCQWDESESGGKCHSAVGSGSCTKSDEGTSINPNVQYRYRPTSWVNENDYNDIKNKFINDLKSTTPVTPDGKSLSDLIGNSLKSEEMDTSIETKLDNLQKSILNIQKLNQTSTGFLNNIDHLGRFKIIIVKN